MKNVGNSNPGRSQGVMNIFRAPYRAHCAVNFATAQLSCILSRAMHCVLQTIRVGVLHSTKFDVGWVRHWRGVETGVA